MSGTSMPLPSALAKPCPSTVAEPDYVVPFELADGVAYDVRVLAGALLDKESLTARRRPGGSACRT